MPQQNKDVYPEDTTLEEFELVESMKPFDGEFSPLLTLEALSELVKEGLVYKENGMYFLTDRMDTL